RFQLGVRRTGAARRPRRTVRRDFALHVAGTTGSALAGSLERRSRHGERAFGRLLAGCDLFRITHRETPLWHAGESLRSAAGAARSTAAPRRQPAVSSGT